MIVKGKNKLKPYTVRYQMDGRQRERSFRTKREADAFKAKYEHDIRASVFVDPRNGAIPFAAYARQWIDALDRAPGTREGYRGLLSKHIAPAFAGRTLAQVAADREGVTALLASMREAGLSGSRCGAVRSLILGTVDEAVRAGRIPAHRLGAISVRREVASPAVIIPATRAQLEAIAAGLRPELALTVWLMLGCGLRISECLAVRLDSFREDGKVLRVSEQVSRTGDLVPLKGRRAGEYRDVPVPEWAWSLGRAHAERFSVQPGTQGPPCLFVRPGGSPVTYRGYHDRFRSRACRAGLPTFTEHDLRHL